MEISTENYQLKWHSFGTHLHGCVAAALNGDYFTDVALLTMDGRQIFAHRFILSACSQYLHQVLKLQSKVSTMTPLIIILPPEITYKTLKVLIQYMYSGETTVSQDILESVLRGGDLLKVKGLWRPREEDGADKRMNVKLHHTSGSNTSTPASTPRSEQSVIKEPKKDVNKHKEKDKGKEEEKRTEVNKTDSVIKTTAKETAKNKEPPKESANKEKKDKDNKEKDEEMMQILVIKEEPIEWSEVKPEDIELVDHGEIFDSELLIKPEVHMDEDSEELYTPLTCELCSETFTIPADWVKHVQTHTDMMPAKRQKRGRPSSDEDNGHFPPLQCDMCQEYFPTPAKWVQHIQFAHTEQEMHASNATNRPFRSIRSSTSRYSSPTHKVCTVCDKKFPSHASMLIHIRTHTGERPYMCDYCCKGFNVKSNLLRHLRTLHDKYVNATDVENKEDETVGDS